MCRRSLFLSIIVIGLFSGVTWAEPIVVENFSFELPNAGKQTGFDNVPGWSTDSAVSDSGVETGYTPTEGEWTNRPFGSSRITQLSRDTYSN